MAKGKATSIQSIQTLEVADNFHKFEQMIANIEELKSYEIQNTLNGVVVLYKDGATKVFISSDVWLNVQKRKSFLERIESQGIMLVFVGSSLELKKIEAFEKHPKLQMISFPITTDTLLLTIDNMHNLQVLIDQVTTEKVLVEKKANEIQKILSISKNLNGLRNIDNLLQMILQTAREITHSDAGSIYTVERGKNDHYSQFLVFKLTQNDSISFKSNEFELPINEDSIAGNVVLSKKTINIPDLYFLDEMSENLPFKVKHDRSWDKRLGYESHSMMTLPMQDINGNVIGVIQLINRKKSFDNKLKSEKDFTNYVQPFSEIDQEYAEIVAQQAGIALENAKMNKEIELLFDGFVNASVTAIEQRDPTTSGHSHRVATFTLGLADIVHRTQSGKFGKIIFNEDQLKEIRYASLLHDFGKLGVRENVLIKAKKLYPWQYELLQERFELIKATYEIEYLRNCVAFMQNPAAFPVGFNLEMFQAERNKKMADIENYLQFIEKSNEPTVLKEGSFELLSDIASCTFNDSKRKDRPFLSSDELKALSVTKGSLTAEEFAEIQSHVTHTYNFLKRIPWGSKLANVPNIAAQHHEKLDGTGYPKHNNGQIIPVQSQMMTIADIFDALTASDRPYKKAIPVERALDIIGMEVKEGKIDKDLFQLFLDGKVYDNGHS